MTDSYKIHVSMNWLSANAKKMAAIRGYTKVDPLQVLPEARAWLATNTSSPSANVGQPSSRPWDVSAVPWWP